MKGVKNVMNTKGSFMDISKDNDFSRDKVYHKEDAMCIKKYLKLTPPSEYDTLADADRLLSALSNQYPNVDLSYEVLKRDYPSFRKEDWQVTVTLIYNGRSWSVASIESGDTTDSSYSLAVDLGSTTVSMSLLDLNTGRVVDEESSFNDQIAYGEDILNRIFHAHIGEKERKELKRSTTDTLSRLMNSLSERTGVNLRSCPVMAIAGNTTMIHFLLGIDAFSIFMSPFSPIFNKMALIPGRAIGLDFSGFIYCMPSAANYLGGDILSGILAADLMKDEQISLYIDIGTNGEMVIGNSEFLVAGAGAAGPALEGGISRFGMRADDGAVDTVSIENGRLTVTTIGNRAVRGICGSGIVDLLSALLLNGWMDFEGKLLSEKSERIVNIEDEAAIVYAWGSESADGKDRYFLQRDISNFMNTKAAASTMVSCLLQETGIEAKDVAHIYTAGSFGKYLNLESAITVGLYPDLPREKFICIGNGSLKGALCLLSDRSFFKYLDKITPNMQYLQFAMVRDFVSRMQEARFFPHTNLDAYPSVKEKLIKNGILKTL